MKRLVLSAALLTSSSVYAVSPGGSDCGWGNMLFEGQSGLPAHLLASITNGTSGNQTFGMTFGTNGCSVDGGLSYGGESMLAFSNILDEFSEDVAQGQGEAIDAVAVMMGIEVEDRDERLSNIDVGGVCATKSEAIGHHCIYGLV